MTYMTFGWEQEDVKEKGCSVLICGAYKYKTLAHKNTFWAYFLPNFSVSVTLLFGAVIW